MAPKTRELSLEDKLEIRGNDFKIPHLKKQVHRRAGKPIVNVTCDAETILKAHEFLDKSIE